MRRSRSPLHPAIEALRCGWCCRTRPRAWGQKVAAVMGVDAQRELDDALRRFKQLLETGEIVRSDGSPTGTDARAQRSQQPAQPSGDDQ